MPRPGRVRRALAALGVLAAAALASDGREGPLLPDPSAAPAPALARRAQLDLSLGPITPALSAAADLPAEHGLFVHAVAPGGPADRAGVRRGDLVVALDGEPIVSLEAFLAAAAARRAGDVLALTVRRRGWVFEASLPLRALPAERGRGLRVEHGAQRVEGALWRTLTTLPEPGPQPAARPPALLVVDEDGGGSVDRPFAEHDPLRDLLHALGRAGVATQRLERAGRGDSEPGPLTPRTERSAFGAALLALAQDPRVAPGGAFVLAIGGAAPLGRALAAEHGAAGLVTLDAAPAAAPAPDGPPELALSSPVDADAAARLAAWMRATAGAAASVHGGVAP